MEQGPQVDLLHHARRLWRSITRDCSLKAIERDILGVTREMDVAGEDIPLVWLEFLRTGSPGILPVVFQHNMTDITSVARLYGVIGSLLRGDVEETPVDKTALGGLAPGALTGKRCRPPWGGLPERKPPGRRCAQPSPQEARGMGHGCRNLAGAPPEIEEPVRRGGAGEAPGAQGARSQAGAGNRGDGQLMAAALERR